MTARPKTTRELVLELQSKRPISARPQSSVDLRSRVFCDARISSRLKLRDWNVKDAQTRLFKDRLRGKISDELIDRYFASQEHANYSDYLEVEIKEKAREEAKKIIEKKARQEIARQIRRNQSSTARTFNHINELINLVNKPRSGLHIKRATRKPIFEIEENMKAVRLVKQHGVASNQCLKRWMEKGGAFSYQDFKSLAFDF